MSWSSEPPAGRVRGGPSGWLASATAVIGADHRRRGVEMQDHARSERSPEGDVTVITVADGHGGDRHFRSAIGAELACATFLSVVERRLGDGRGRRDLEPALSDLIDDIVTGWKARVTDDLARRPIQPADRRFRAARTAMARRDAHAAEEWTHQIVAGVGAQADLARVATYGSTLLGMAVCAGGILWFQLGDGSLVETDDTGRARLLCARHASAFGDVTPSLCSVNASRYAQAGISPVGPNSPGLVAAITDGFSNSFEEEDGMLAFFEGVIPMVRDRGAVEVHRFVPRWLGEMTRDGSGDDIALAWALRVGAESETPR